MADKHLGSKAAEIDAAVNAAHKHENKPTIDQLGETSEGKLTFKGAPVNESGGGVESWAEIEELPDFPDAFPPDTHKHGVADINDFPTLPLETPRIEMYIGGIGKHSSSELGVWLRITNPWAVKPGDKVVFRHSIAGNVAGGIYPTTDPRRRRGTQRRMALITRHPNELQPMPWHNCYPEITDLEPLSVKAGASYEWVKVAETPHYNLPTLIKLHSVSSAGIFYWAGNRRYKSIKGGEHSSGNVLNGRNINSCLFDCVIMREKTIIAESNRFLLKAHCEIQYAGSENWYSNWREV